MPKISVVIPLFNKGFSIKRTIESVLTQNFTDFELLIVNDGSTDNSCSVVKTFTDYRIHLIHQENKGAAAARNLGIEKATSSLIAFLDADDFWKTNHLSELYKLYLDFPDCAIYCSRYTTKMAKNLYVKTNLLDITDDYRGIITDFFKSSYVNRVATTSSVLLSKKILIQHNGFDTAISSGQDLDLWIRLAIDNKVAINNVVSAIYEYQIPNSLSKTKITHKTLPDFSQFKIAEQKNESLKKFLDLYRIEYGLHFRIYGEVKKSNSYLKDVTTTIPFKTKVLLKMPPFILQKLLQAKHWLRSKGIDFTVYH
ncbi:glycosyltransferase family 2 protein [Flavobacterium sp.]|uniref:glycosyltransferase family 2 protein n=1 Tax=Flavobacterium sp. TaxID=239 RepID=UPI003527C6D2